MSRSASISLSEKALTRRSFIRSSLAVGAIALAGGGIPTLFASGKSKPNVLFIAVDDLRPELGCYGVPVIRTPNIDALANRGIVFTRAYCQQAICNASRASLLTGLRPDTTKVYDLQTHFRVNVPDAVTLPQYFKEQGYYTCSFSKIFHGELDDPQSWSTEHWRPKMPAYGDKQLLAELKDQEDALRAQGKVIGDRVLERDPKTGAVLKTARNTVKAVGPPWESPDVPDNALADGKTADKVIETLGSIQDKPFFLAAGFLKPHLPFVAPKKYFDMYPPVKLHMADNPFPPKDCPEYALAHWGELRQYRGIPKKGPLVDKQALELIRGYYAATSYTDAQIGRVINELDRLGLRDNTIIVLWGDHGWQLGEHGEWCKHTNFEVATHAPLIISAPGQKNPGSKTNALSEFVDIYPTLCELSGLRVPRGLEGKSLVPVMDRPSRPWKKAVFSQYPRGKVMGHSMRTERYRYTEWAEPGKEPAASELYDHQNDPKENVNIANLPENKLLVTELSKQLQDGWKSALP